MSYNPDQQRDDHGRWGAGGGEATLRAVAASRDAASASKKAGRVDVRPGRGNITNDSAPHDRAVTLHRKAAEAHEAIGNTEAAQAHRVAAEAHAAILYTHAQAHGAQPGRLARLQKSADELHEKAQQASLRAWSTVKERS